MNKKVLYESIMKNVAKEVKKALNEGFSEWKEQNMPKFDYEMFRYNLTAILNICKDLFFDKQIIAIALRVTDDKALHVLKAENAKEGIDEFIGKCYEALNKMTSDKQEHPKLLNNSNFVMVVNPGSAFEKYLQANYKLYKGTVDNCDYARVFTLPSNKMGLQFNTKDILEHIHEILEFLE